MKQFKLENNKLEIIVKRSSLFIRSFVLFLSIFCFLFPMLGIIGAMIFGDGFHFGFLIGVVIFGLLGFFF